MQLSDYATYDATQKKYVAKDPSKYQVTTDASGKVLVQAVPQQYTYDKYYGEKQEDVRSYIPETLEFSTAGALQRRIVRSKYTYEKGRRRLQERSYDKLVEEYQDGQIISSVDFVQQSRSTAGGRTRTKIMPRERYYEKIDQATAKAEAERKAKALAKPVYSVEYEGKVYQTTNRKFRPQSYLAREQALLNIPKGTRIGTLKAQASESYYFIGRIPERGTFRASEGFARKAEQAIRDENARIVVSNIKADMGTGAGPEYASYRVTETSIPRNKVTRLLEKYDKFVDDKIVANLKKTPNLGIQRTEIQKQRSEALAEVAGMMAKYPGLPGTVRFGYEIVATKGKILAETGKFLLEKTKTTEGRAYLQGLGAGIILTRGPSRGSTALKNIATTKVPKPPKYIIEVTKPQFVKTIQKAVKFEKDIVQEPVFTLKIPTPSDFVQVKFEKNLPQKPLAEIRLEPNLKQKPVAELIIEQEKGKPLINKAIISPIKFQFVKESVKEPVLDIYFTKNKPQKPLAELRFESNIQQKSIFKTLIATPRDYVKIKLEKNLPRRSREILILSSKEAKQGLKSQKKGDINIVYPESLTNNRFFKVYTAEQFATKQKKLRGVEVLPEKSSLEQFFQRKAKQLDSFTVNEPPPIKGKQQGFFATINDNIIFVEEIEKKVQRKPLKVKKGLSKKERKVLRKSFTERVTTAGIPKAEVLGTYKRGKITTEDLLRDIELADATDALRVTEARKVKKVRKRFESKYETLRFMEKEPLQVKKGKKVVSFEELLKSKEKEKPATGEVKTKQPKQGQILLSKTEQLQKGKLKVKQIQLQKVAQKAEQKGKRRKQVFLVPQQQIGLFDVPLQQQKTRSLTLTKAQKRIQRTKEILKQQEEERLRMISGGASTGQLVGLTEQRFAGRQQSQSRQVFRTLTTLEPEPPTTPNFAFFHRDDDPFKRTEKENKKRKRSRKDVYRPTLTSIVYGFTGTPSEIGVKSGLGVRPITISRRKKK